MKALSLLQPWASLVVMGFKTIETRSWNTRFRGAMLIHASKGKRGGALSLTSPFKKHIPDFNALPFGALIGKVDLIDVVHMESLGLSDAMINKLSLEEKAFGDYSTGRYAWILENPICFLKPIPAKGMISIWDYPDESIND